jgi:hypothetical protein|tara:strand:- start:117 stop:242 length:126 start_codon:yes stop_codon:yes gene_type:complete
MTLLLSMLLACGDKEQDTAAEEVVEEVDTASETEEVSEGEE